MKNLKQMLNDCECDGEVSLGYFFVIYIVGGGAIYMTLQAIWWIWLGLEEAPSVIFFALAVVLTPSLWVYMETWGRFLERRISGLIRKLSEWSSSDETK